MISSFVEDNHKNWDQFLKEFAYALRTAVQRDNRENAGRIIFRQKTSYPVSEVEKPPGNYKFNKRRVPSSIHSGPSTRKRTRRAEVNGRHVLSREPSPCLPRTAEVNKGQTQSRKSNPCSSRGAVATKRRPVRSRRVQPEKSSPYGLRSRHQFSGRQEQSRMSRVHPYKRHRKGTTHQEIYSEQRNQGIQDL
ncbi:hypothetical protein TNCV_4071501 [Trichonephila clavipes]|uniref:Uncharacterized protein n=1 Tax=Trichonephila clavipes TaxID=2585209 RepID=A0A8X7BGT6_TRICX|nr:hypothetical protein TNCV_4071501 [Trichonephila clavipes]